MNFPILCLADILFCFWAELIISLALSGFLSAFLNVKLGVLVVINFTEYVTEVLFNQAVTFSFHKDFRPKGECFVWTRLRIMFLDN